MFLLYFTEVDVPVERVRELLPELVVRLDGLGEDAYRVGEELRVRVGPSSYHRLTAKTVTLRAGTPIDSESSTSIPLFWEATGTPGLFPKMTADLIIAPLDDRQTQLRFHGSYEPPLGAIGKLLDRSLFHRVAESSVKDLVDRIATSLENDAGSTGMEKT